MRKTSERTAERGQATVEFAIVLPLVLLLIAGLIAFGTAFNYWISLNHIANEGSRWASVDRLPARRTHRLRPSRRVQGVHPDQVLTEDLRAKVTDPTTGEPTGIDLCVSVTRAPPAPEPAVPVVGDAVRVTISAPYSFPVVSGMIELARQLFGGDTTDVGDVMLTGSSTVRLEQTPRPADWYKCTA